MSKPLIGVKSDITCIGGLQKNAAIMKNQSPALTQAMGNGGGHVPIIIKKEIGVVNNKGTLREVERCSCIDANYHKGMDNHAARTMVKAVLTPDRLEKRQNGRRFKEDGEPAFTLNTQDKHGVYDGIKIRKLTPKECERLQGFPDDWTKYGHNDTLISDTQRYKMCGNAVTVSVVQYIASHFEFPS